MAQWELVSNGWYNSRVRHHPAGHLSEPDPCPGRMHDQSAERTEGIADLLEQFPDVKAKVDSPTWGW